MIITEAFIETIIQKLIIQEFTRILIAILFGL